MSAEARSSDAIAIPKGPLRQAGIIAGIVAAVAIVVLVIVVLVKSFSGSDSLASAINHNEFQAVFLANGQVYFGKLSAPGGDFYDLRDVYYLASQTSPQGAKQPRQRLIKLGSEIHGPEDLMVINRSEILFVENLKPTGQVTRAILRAQPAP